MCFRLQIQSNAIANVPYVTTESEAWVVFLDDYPAVCVTQCYNYVTIGLCSRLFTRSFTPPDCDFQLVVICQYESLSERSSSTMNILIISFDCSYFIETCN